jgi:hypothetical protein
MRELSMRQTMVKRATTETVTIGEQYTGRYQKEQVSIKKGTIDEFP